MGVMGGGFITMGALFSLLLAEGVEAEGPKRLIEGLGFSAGFFFVILSEAVLFTEANVVLPATILYRHTSTILRKISRSWALAWLGKFLGAWLVGIGNVIGGEFLVALPFLFALRPKRECSTSIVGLI
jgi:formate transporter